MGCPRGQRDNCPPSLANGVGQFVLRGCVSTPEGAEELVLRLILTATPAERDLLLILGDGDSPEQVAQRLGLTPSALAVRLNRLRRRAATLDM